MPGLRDFFETPITATQRRYEAIRAVEMDNISVANAAAKFNYTEKTLYTYIRDVKAGKLDLFPKNITPFERQTPECVRKQIVKYRNKNLSATDIKELIVSEGYKISVRTVERIIEDAGLPRLKRRTRAERGFTKKQQLTPKRATIIDFKKLEPFTTDCPVVGVFFFLPYIIDSGILDIVNKCKLPTSSVIKATQANLSMLLLKLIGSERLSDINAYNHEPAFGLFTGLTMLPKDSYMTSYSCRTSEEMMLDFQRQLMTHFQNIYSDFYKSDFINLDFHSIPHYGTESQMEKVWCGAKHQVIKGANTSFAQDSDSNVILYTRADILRKDETKEVQNFVTYWKTIKGKVEETLVFDCKFTNYKILDDLNTDGIHYITLRKRNKKLIRETTEIEEEKWSSVYISIPKRKHKKCRVYESQVILKEKCAPVRQIIIKDHGRAEPTYVVTNNMGLKIKEILTVYAKRWRIENKFSELASFFNLNALTSPLMVRIHFGILWTMIADTLYHRFAQDLPRFEHERANTIFKRFINMPGKVTYDGRQFIIKIRKRAHTPILMKQKLMDGVQVPWLDNKIVRVQWTA
jgi:transposase